MKTEILNVVRRTIADVEEYAHTFREYDYIWLDDKQEHLESVIGIGGNYLAIEGNDLFNDSELQQFRDKSICLFSEQVRNVSSSVTIFRQSSEFLELKPIFTDRLWY